MNRSTTDRLRNELVNWEHFFSRHSGVALLPSPKPMDALRHGVRNLRRRLREGPTAPVRIAFFGATGAGKSKLFSSVIGQPISQSGYLRPCTRESCFFLHEHWRSMQDTLDGRVHLHQIEQWLDKILIDTPDFDSIEVANRAEAERVFADADAFVFVADGLKYADASTWSYLTAIHESRKELIVILNKVDSETIVNSFLSRYRGSIARDDPTAVLPRPIVVPEFRIQDDDLIPADHPALRQLIQAVDTLRVDEGPTARGRMLQLETDLLCQAAEGHLTEIRHLQARVRDLRTILVQRLKESEQRLDERLSVALDSGMREEVFQRVLRRIEKMDVLRYPRRVLSLPVRAVRYLLYDRWRRKPTDTATSLADEKADAASFESFQILEAEVLQLANQLRVDFVGEEAFRQLLTRDRFRELRPDHDELRGRFADQDKAFRSWVETHAVETAAQITTENKAKFFLSQLLFNSVLITAQVHSGGLSLVELGLDGVVSPVMAKGIGVLIGHEKVREFETAARREHQRALSHLLADLVQRFRNFLDQSSAGLDELAATLASIVDFKPLTTDLVQEFLSRDPGRLSSVPSVRESGA